MSEKAAGGGSSRRPERLAYSLAMGPFDWRRLSPEHWFFGTPEPIDHPLYVVLAAMQTLAFAAAAVARLLADPLLADRPAARRALCRAATVAGLLAAVGLVLLLFRWQPMPFFSKRLWLYVWWVGVAAAVTWAALAARRRGAPDTVAA